MKGLANRQPLHFFAAHYIIAAPRKPYQSHKTTETMKYRGVVQEKVNANNNALEQMKERLERGTLDPNRALNWLQQCIKRNESVQQYLDAEDDEFGFDADEQRAQKRRHESATS